MKYPRDYFGTIIIDEAHHTAAKTYKGILEHFIDAKVLGVTATPDRSDMKSLSDIFDSLAFEYKLPDAIREGYLCKINTKTIPVEETSARSISMPVISVRRTWAMSLTCIWTRLRMPLYENARTERLSSLRRWYESVKDYAISSISGTSRLQKSMARLRTGRTF